MAILGDGMRIDRHAVVKQNDIPDELQIEMAAFAQEFGISQELTSGQGLYVPHFSQALVVSGSRTTTGHAVVLGEPRVPVNYPNIFYEWHMVGKTFEVRGVGVPGSPNVLIGSTPGFAWSPTALGLDQADLFRLETDTKKPDRYRLDGLWVPYVVDELETILVKGGSPFTLAYRETVWGPVIGAPFIQDVRPGEVYSVKAVPLAIPKQDSIRGFLSMYRADTLDDFRTALGGWTYPSANIVFAGKEGDIGYAALGAVPIRKSDGFLAGLVAQEGNTTANDWQTYLPHSLRPMVLNTAHHYR